MQDITIAYLGFYIGLFIFVGLYTWAFIRALRRKQHIISTLLLIGFAVQVFFEIPIAILSYSISFFPILYLIIDIILVKKQKKKIEKQKS